MFAEPFRHHFSITIEKTFRGIWILLVIVLANFDDVLGMLESGGLDRLLDNRILLGAVAVILVAYGMQVWRWLRTFITFENDSLVVERRGLNRKKTVISLSNVAAINLTRNPFQRLVGTSRLKIDTNSPLTAAEADAVLVLKNNMAETFRQYVAARSFDADKWTNGESQEPKAMEEVAVAYSVPMAFRHSLLSISPIGLLFTISFFFFITLRQLLPQLQSDLHANLWRGSLTLAVLLVPMILDAVLSLYRCYNLKVRRSGDRLYAESGWLTRRANTIPLEKISGLQIRQSGLSRLLGYASASVLIVGAGEKAEIGRIVLVPMVRRQEVFSYLEKLIPEWVADYRVGMESRQPGRSRLARGIRFGLIMGGAGGTATVAATLLWNKANIPEAWLWPTVAVGWLLLAIFWGTLVWMDYVTRGLWLGEQKMSAVSGLLARRYTVFLYQKVQTLEMIQGPIQRRLGLKKIRLTLLAAGMNMSQYIGLYPEEIGERVAERIIPRMEESHPASRFYETRTNVDELRGESDDQA